MRRSRPSSTFTLAAVILIAGTAIFLQRALSPVLGVAALAMAVAGAWIVRGIARVAMGRRMTVPLRGDYILFVRSFADDEVGAYIGANQAFETQEPAFLRQLERLGAPCLVESPRRRIPRDVIGYRLFITDPDQRGWLDVISALARGARYIALLIGTSRGLEAELAMLADAGLLTKTVAFMPDRYHASTKPLEADRRWRTFIGWLGRSRSPGAADSARRLARVDGSDVSGVYWYLAGDRLEEVVVPGRLGQGYEATVSHFVHDRGLPDREPLETRSLGTRLAGAASAVTISLLGARIYRLGTHAAYEIALAVLCSAAGFLLGVWTLNRTDPVSLRYWRVLRGDGRSEDTVLLCVYYLFVALALAHGGA